MRNYLVVIKGCAPIILQAANRTAARGAALNINGFTPNGPAPRGMTIATL